MLTHVKKSLAGKVAIVTGGGRGVGRKISERLGSDGAFVIVNYRSDRDAAEAVVQEIEALGSGAVAIQGDVGSVSSIRAFYREANDYLTSRLGANKIDILVNNASMLWPHGLEASVEDYDRIMAVNLKGPVFMAAEVSSRMPDGGRIINISSIAAKSAQPMAPLYSIARHGLTGFTRNLALAFGARRICVNGIELGLTTTDPLTEIMAGRGTQTSAGYMTADCPPHSLERCSKDDELDPYLAIAKASIAMGRIGNPSDIADVVSFFASENSHWITGQSFGVDGGLRL